jgi:hypothetical protein
VKRYVVCIHVCKARLKLARERLGYHESTIKYESNAFCISFEHAQALFMWGKTEEFSYICNLILALAYANPTVNGDDIYWALGGLFVGANYRILGAAWNVVQKKGFIIRVGTHFSEREIAHGGDHGIYQITDAGRQMLNRNE